MEQRHVRYDIATTHSQIPCQSHIHKSFPRYVHPRQPEQYPSQNLWLLKLVTIDILQIMCIMEAVLWKKTHSYEI
jgi:hypothetical protein